MEHFEDQFLPDRREPLGIPFGDEEPNFFQAEEAPEGEEFAATAQVEESIYTDDPVRVYLREMGAVLRSADAKEGPLAFAEKRQPVWKAQ